MSRAAEPLPLDSSAQVKAGVLGGQAGHDEELADGMDQSLAAITAIAESTSHAVRSA